MRDGLGQFMGCHRVFGIRSVLFIIQECTYANLYVSLPFFLGVREKYCKEYCMKPSPFLTFESVFEYCKQMSLGKLLHVFRSLKKLLGLCQIFVWIRIALVFRWHIVEN